MQASLTALFTLGLVAALQSTQSEAEHVSRCSYAGVVHLEGSSRYSLNFQQARQLCQSLGYSLATEEQLNKAYEKGLKTCRFGWIEDQKVFLLPHDVDPNCTFSGIISHAEKEDKLYDVYCFSQTDSLESNCETAHTSTPTSANSQPATSKLTTTIARPDPEEDVLGEVVADGFIVDVKGTTSFVKSKTSFETSKPATTPNSLNSEGKTTHSPQEDSVTTVSVPRTPEVTTVGHEDDTSSTTVTAKKENAETSATIISDQDATTFPTAQTMSPEITTEETINMNIEGSGMLLEILHEEDPLPSNSTRSSVGGLHSKPRLFRPAEVEEGSGMEPEVTTSDAPASTTQTTFVFEEKENAEFIGINDSKTETNAAAPVEHKARNGIYSAKEAEPTTSAQAEEGTPGWLIIFAFCMTLGAILCVFAGIATKDMWYGPSRRSLNITPQDSNDEYGKSATLPLSEKEQELVTLMKATNGQKNDKDFTVISLEEAPEKEYLM